MSACCLNFRSVDVIFTYYVKGKPLFEMCCFHMGIAHMGGEGVKACQDSLGHFFFHVGPAV